MDPAPDPKRHRTNPTPIDIIDAMIEKEYDEFNEMIKVATPEILLEKEVHKDEGETNILISVIAESYIRLVDDLQFEMAWKLLTNVVKVPTSLVHG